MNATEEVVEAGVTEEEGAPSPALGVTVDMKEQQGNEGPTAKADESSPAGGFSYGEDETTLEFGVAGNAKLVRQALSQS